MRNSSCVFADYGYRYDNDNCQGCMHASGSISDRAEELRKQRPRLTIKQVYFNKPVTVVLWEDGTKTIVKCQEGDTYSKETGLAVAIAKKALGNKGNFNETFKKWIPEYRKDG